MRLLRSMLCVAEALGVVSALAGVAGLMYWLGASLDPKTASVFGTVASGLLLGSGVAALATALRLESLLRETGAATRRLRAEYQEERERFVHERDFLASERDATRTRVRRLERRAESLYVVREIHRSTNIITRSERLRQILTVIGQLAGDIEATLFAVRECTPLGGGAGGGETDPRERLRPVAYHAARDSDELFIRFDRAFGAEAALGVADALVTTNGPRREVSGDLVAEGEPVGRIEAVMHSTDGFGVAAEAAPEDVLAWILGGVDLDCARASVVLERGKVISTHDRSGDDIEFLYPLAAEGEMVGVFRLRVPRREVAEAGAGGLDELDEVLAECARHVALALKKETDADRAMIDGLTGLLLKREFEPRLAEALSKSVAERGPVALLVVDIDHFKQVNDTYGHRTGDLILRGVAGLVRRHVRARDSAYRYGGEELCLVLPDTGAREARAIAERLRKSVEAARFSECEDTGEAGSESVGVTISIGLAASNPGNQRRRNTLMDPADPADFFRRADTALYRAKDTGRNKVVVWTSRMKKSRASSAKSAKKRKNRSSTARARKGSGKARRRSRKAA